jgi:pyruvate-ferredoxin/flavodoxin oxidoreductase
VTSGRATDASPLPGTVEVPVRAQRSLRHDDTLTSLSRFWDHVGVLYRDGRLDELSPDPYLGTGALPPYSASLTPAAPTALPVLDTTRCTGCGDCWTLCPEGALGVTWLTPKELLEHGLEEAKRAGSDPGALQMILSKLASGLARAMGEDAPPAHAGVAVRAVFDGMAEKLPEARRDALREAAGAVATALDRWPLVRTKALYDDAEKDEPGAGTLLSIVADPDACTSCALCARVCETEAIPLVPVTDASHAEAHAAWALWSRLPDPKGPALARASRNADVGLAAATFASRHASMAAASARRDGAGSGEMLAIRLVLGAAESARQPILADLGREVETLRSALAGQVQDLLAEALPTSDLDALARGLSLSAAHEVSLGEIAQRLEHAESERRVDRDRLAAIVDVARRLADLGWRVTRGFDGTGRARVALLVAGEGLAARAAHFPDTIFASPALVDSSPEAAHTACGILHGLSDTLLEDVRLMRRARLLLERPLVEANTATEAMATLSWSDLTDDEKRWCTPLVVLADEASLGSSALALVETIVTGARPATVVLLSEVETTAANDDRELAMLGLAAGRAFAVQSSIGAPDHLVRGVRDALVRRGPSIVRVHAPSPARHGFAADGAAERAVSAIAARVHPLLRYDPGAGDVFGAGISLDGNPEPLARWTRDDDARHRTPADWASGETRHAARFIPLEEGAIRVSVAEYVGLSGEARRAKSPTVVTAEGDRAVDDALIAWCASRLSTWRTLQELAGLVTPFTDRVREGAEQEVSARHAAEIESLRETHARELRAKEEGVRHELYTRVRDRLALLAARGRELTGGRR